ncbi:MAG: hypothetical protein ACO1NO_11745 [Burkholderiaceae bacterium]
MSFKNYFEFASSWFAFDLIHSTVEPAIQYARLNDWTTFTIGDAYDGPTGAAAYLISVKRLLPFPAMEEQIFRLK